MLELQRAVRRILSRSKSRLPPGKSLGQVQTKILVYSQVQLKLITAPDAYQPLKILIQPSVPFRDCTYLFLQFFRQIFLLKPPSPVISNRGRLIHPAAVVKPHVILDRNDTGLGVAPHYQGDEGLV